MADLYSKCLVCFSKNMCCLWILAAFFWGLYFWQLNPNASVDLQCGMGALVLFFPIVAIVFFFLLTGALFVVCLPIAIVQFVVHKLALMLAFVLLICCGIDICPYDWFWYCWNWYDDNPDCIECLQCLRQIRKIHADGQSDTNRVAPEPIPVPCTMEQDDDNKNTADIV